MIKYFVRTTLERRLHDSFSQVAYSLLIDKEHKLREIFLGQLENISDFDVVLLEDDIILCNNFKERIEKIIQSHSNEIINFFFEPFDYFESKYKEFAYNQCTYYPSIILKDIINFFKNNKKPSFVKTPEEHIKYYLHKQKKFKVYTYRPCLVQHIDNKSILNKHPVSIPRRTPYFIDYLEDLNISYEEAQDQEKTQQLIDYMNKQFTDNNDYIYLLSDELQQQIANERKQKDE